MSQIRIAKRGDIGAFPGSKFVVDDTPPIAQCQETQFTVLGPSWPPSGSVITAAGSTFDDISLLGKICTIAGSASDDGDYEVLAQTSTTLTIDHTFIGTEGVATVIVHDDLQAYLTRNKQSFAKYIDVNYKAYTIKGGQLYTDLADPPMDDACSDTWSPD